MNETRVLDVKGKAADFLTGLKAHLNSKLPLETVKDWIREKGKAANEGLFLEELALPAIPEYLQQNLVPPATGVLDERIRKAFLTSSHDAGGTTTNTKATFVLGRPKATSP